jgi:hypothetical protein
MITWVCDWLLLHLKMDAWPFVLHWQFLQGMFLSRSFISGWWGRRFINYICKVSQERTFSPFAIPCLWRFRTWVKDIVWKFWTYLSCQWMEFSFDVVGSMNCHVSFTITRCEQWFCRIWARTVLVKNHYKPRAQAAATENVLHVFGIKTTWGAKLHRLDLQGRSVSTCEYCWITSSQFWITSPNLASSRLFSHVLVSRHIC